MVLEVLSVEFKRGCPWELLYADDLALIAEAMEELTIKLKTWKLNMETKGLRVNMGTIKFLVSNRKFTVNREEGKHPCSVCLKGIDKPEIFFVTCEHWVHVNGKCSGFEITDMEEGRPPYSCKVCTDTHRRTKR